MSGEGDGDNRGGVPLVGPTLGRRSYRDRLFGAPILIDNGGYGSDIWALGSSG